MTDPLFIRVSNCCNYITTSLAEAAATDPIISSGNHPFYCVVGKNVIYESKQPCLGSDAHARPHARLWNGFPQAEEFTAKAKRFFFMV